MSVKKKAKLKNLRINEISIVDEPANPGARMVMHKRMEKINFSDEQKEGIIKFLKKIFPKGEEPSGDSGDARKNETQKGVKKVDEEKIKKMLEEALKPVGEISKTVKTLQERLDVSEAISKLGDVERKHYDSLNDEEKTAFLKLSDEDRKKKVEGVSKKKDESSEKQEVPEQVQKKMDELEKRLAEQTRKAEDVQFQKEASQLFDSLPGTEVQKGSALRGVRCMAKEESEALLTMLKAGNAAMATQLKQKGKGGGEGSDSASAELDKLAHELAKEKNISFEKAYSDVLETQKGRELYKKINTERHGE
jgi:hypothetical protein